MLRIPFMSYAGVSGVSLASAFISSLAFTLSFPTSAIFPVLFHRQPPRHTGTLSGPDPQRWGLQATPSSSYGLSLRAQNRSSRAGISPTDTAPRLDSKRARFPLPEAARSETSMPLGPPAVRPQVVVASRELSLQEILEGAVLGAFSYIQTGVCVLSLNKAEVGHFM